MGEQSALSIERTHLAGAVEDVGGTPTRLKADESTGSLRVGLFVWDTDGLEWVKMTQPALEADLDQVEALLAGSYWQRTFSYAYASDRIKYLCKNTDIDANSTDADWKIWKYSDSDLPAMEGPRIGAINTEAVIDSLAWNI